MRTAIARFRRRLDDLEKFEPKTVRDRSDSRIKALEVAIDEALAEAFGHDTPAYLRYSAATTIDRASHYIGRETPLPDVIEGLESGKERAASLLAQAVRYFEEKLADAGAIEQPGPAPAPAPAPYVFIVHGQDGPAKIEVTHFIERAGLNAIVLHEQAAGGKTIIEKLEEHGGAAGYAVVLMTPDDVGGPAGGEMKPRARQNVIGELFWFAGKLGRSRVAALRKGDVEIPSDLHGIVYISMDDRNWKTELLKELTNAGYKVDWERALK
jgi:predicted nucleotide-binding protein